LELPREEGGAGESRGRLGDPPRDRGVRGSGSPGSLLQPTRREGFAAAEIEPKGSARAAPGARTEAVAANNRGVRRLGGQRELPE